jgi:ABC-type antimicrobial peptide transport system permease subunit
LKNYNTHSLHESIKPLVIDVKEYENFGVIIVRTTPGKTKEALASMENAYKSINPNYAFAYQFLDEEYNKLYRNEQVVAKLSNVFAVLAITISCLGLLGLVMFSVEQRAKEFGIRKVLGATVINIVSLISRDFLKLIVISFCIAAPLAGYLMHEWLQGFAYRIELSWWIFALSGAMALMIAIFTICVQAIHSATDNPVNVLKTE